MLITSNEQLVEFIPNTMTTVKGELTLFEKMMPFLQTTEKWLEEIFTSTEVMAVIANMEAEHPTRRLACNIIAVDAFYHAIPQLDVILTPNGFGIVSNSNLAPASKERVERLMAALLQNRDSLLMQLMAILPSFNGWTASEQGMFFAATMFPSLKVTLQFPQQQENRWNQYLAIREEAIAIEEFFAAQYVSKELLEVLRQEVLTGQYRSTTHRRVCRILQAVEMRCLTSKDPSSTMHFQHGDMSELVNTFRNLPEEFPEWHSSHTAELYQPAVFENKKDSQGFWF